MRDNHNDHDDELDPVSAEQDAQGFEGDDDLDKAFPSPDLEDLEPGASPDDEVDEEEDIFEEKGSAPPYLLFGAAAVFLFLLVVGGMKVFGTASTHAPAPGRTPVAFTPAPSPQASQAGRSAQSTLPSQASQVTAGSASPMENVSSPRQAPKLGDTARQPAPMNPEFGRQSGAARDESPAQEVTLDHELLSEVGAEIAGEIRREVLAVVEMHGKSQQAYLSEILDSHATGSKGAPIDMSPVVGRIENLHVKVDSILSTLTKEPPASPAVDVTQQFNALMARLDAMDMRSGTPPVMVGGTYDGRERLPGFETIKTSVDGSMAIVRTPTDRVNVYFKGERFYNQGKLLKVTGITENGWVVLVEDRWFIDAQRDPVSANRSSRTTTRKVAPQVEKVVRAEVMPVHEPPAPEPVAASGGEAPKENDLATSETKSDPTTGWLVHAVSRDQYLLRGPDMGWHVARKGEVFKELGRVKGLNTNDELVVGTHRIKMSGR